MRKSLFFVLVVVVAPAAALAAESPIVSLSWGGGFSPVARSGLDVFKTGRAVYRVEWHAASGRAFKMYVEHAYKFLEADIKKIEDDVKKSGICSVADNTIYGVGPAIMMDAGVTSISVKLPNCNKRVSYNPASGKPRMPDKIRALQTALLKVSEKVYAPTLGEPGCKN